jgi:hypothetical protein
LKDKLTDQIRERAIRRLRTVAAAVWVCLSAAFPAQAEKTFSRETLFERAFQDLPFVVSMVQLEPGFTKSLTPTEQTTFQILTTVIRDAYNRQWLQKHSVQTFKDQTGKWDSSYHVPYNNEPHRNHSSVRFGMQFSDDPNKFKFDGAERAAMTTAEMTDDIFINRRRINAPDYKLDYSDVIELLIHELGHKIPKLDPDRELPKDQSAIDNVAAKVRGFVADRLIPFETSKGTFHIMSFRKSFFDEYIGHSLAQAKTGDVLQIYDNVGLTVLHEGQDGFTDLTQQILEPVIRRELVKADLPKAYTWTRLNWILTHQVAVKEQANGQIGIEFNFEHSQLMMPFMKSGAPHPRDINLWRSVFGDSPPIVPTRLKRMEALIDFQDSRPRFTGALDRTLRFEDASAEVKKVFVEWQGEDLLARYRFSSSLETKWEGGALSLRPYLLVRAGGQLIEVPSVEKNSTNAEFEFRIPGVKARVGGQIEIVGMEVGPSRENLALTGEARLRIPLRQQDLARFQLPEKPSPASPPVLLEVQIGSAGEFLSLTENPPRYPPRGESLRLVFDSESDLLTLRLLMEYNWRVHMKGPGLDNRQKQRESKWVGFEGIEMKQTREGRRLIVDIKIDENVDVTKTYHQLSGILHRPGWLSGSGSVFQPEERTTAWAGASRALRAVEFTTVGMQNGLRIFDRDRVFRKKSARASCKRLLSDR